MINIRSIKSLKEDDGMTLKNGKRVKFKTGYQVATEGIECRTPEEAMKLWCMVQQGHLLHRQKPPRTNQDKGAESRQRLPANQHPKMGRHESSLLLGIILLHGSVKLRAIFYWAARSRPKRAVICIIPHP